MIARNPRNRDRLLQADPREFARLMRRWTNGYKRSDVALNVKATSAATEPTAFPHGLSRDVQTTTAIYG
jgi:hypothetical protein